jgi:hypothetical protein
MACKEIGRGGRGRGFGFSLFFAKMNGAIYLLSVYNKNRQWRVNEK